MTLVDLDPFFVIKWRMTGACNYNCSYCVRKEQDKRFHFNKDICIERLKEAAGYIKPITDRPIKLDLIGGEVSILPLVDILSNVPKFDRIQITTNLSQPVEYYNSLYDFIHSRGAELSITASFHYEYTSLDDFLTKCSKIKADIFACEMVSTKDNQDLVREFIKKCPYYYKVERDVRWKVNCDERNMDLITSSKKPENLPRYKLIDDNGTTYFNTRNDYLHTTRNGYCDTQDAICYSHKQFLYLEIDTVKMCVYRGHIKDYTYPTEPFNCECGGCSLCGHITIQK